MTTTALILPGAGLPEWLWDDVRARLEMPSLVAPRPTTGDGTVTDYARAALDAAGPGPIVLVAHSAGGVVAAEAARLAAPGQVVGIVAVAAVIPTAGGSFASSMPFPQNIALPLILRLAGTRPPQAAIRRGLASDVDPVLTDRLIADFAPEPRSYFTSRVHSTSELPAITTRSFIFTTQDAEVPVAAQERFAGRLEPHTLIRIPSGHLPMLTHPEEVAGTITRATIAKEQTS